MAISRIDQIIRDNALGLTDGNSERLHVTLGVCSGGTANVLKWYADADLVKSELGTGPLVDKAAYHLPNAGGPIGLMKLNASVAGTAGSVTVTRGSAGDSTAIMTVTGAPNDNYQVQARVTRQGVNLAANTAAFVVSVDGGDNWSEEIAMPVGGVYAPPGTGLTLTWVNGAGPTSFKVGDLFAFDTVAPGYSATDVNAAIDALRLVADAKYFVIHLVGSAADASASAAMAAVLATRANEMEVTDYRYVFFVLEAPDVADGLLQTAFASFVSPRVAVAAGYCELIANNRQMKRSAAWPAVMRACQQSPQRDLARTRPDREGGALPGVVSLARDEYATPGLDSARFTTLRTYPGQPGFFIGKGRLMAAPSSDFRKGWQYRRLMDFACTINIDTQFPLLNDDVVRVDAETGNIVENDARNLETLINEQLRTGMTARGWVSGTFVSIVRDNNIITTSRLGSKVRILPKGYAGDIETEIGFINPAFAPVTS